MYVFMFNSNICFNSLKSEIERLEVEYNENISKEQAKYNSETNKLKGQIFENEVTQKALEKEVCCLILFIKFNKEKKMYLNLLT